MARNPYAGRGNAAGAFNANTNGYDSEDITPVSDDYDPYGDRYDAPPFSAVSPIRERRPGGRSARSGSYGGFYDGSGRSPAVQSMSSSHGTRDNEHERDGVESLAPTRSPRRVGLQSLETSRSYHDERSLDSRELASRAPEYRPRYANRMASEGVGAYGDPYRHRNPSGGNMVMTGNGDGSRQIGGECSQAFVCLQQVLKAYPGMHAFPWSI
jgi:hypothetical protein